MAAAVGQATVGGGTVQGEHLVISGSSVLPEGTWYAGGGSVDAGGNSGWIFSVPLDVHFSGVNGGAGSVAFAPPGDSCASDGGACRRTYASTASVTLTATPTAGSFFTGWGGDCSGTGACTLSMAVARTVTAGFAVGQLFGVVGLFVAVPIISAVVILTEETWVREIEAADARRTAEALKVPPAGAPIADSVEDVPAFEAEEEASRVR